MRRIASLLCAALLSLGVSVGFAAEPGADSMQKARASFHRGVQLYNEGSFEAALAEFGKAYQASPNYRILYNIAQTQYDLHDYVGAFKNLEKYLREGGNEISAERREQVVELNRKAEERIAHVEISCNLDGAEIRVDDLPVGVSPLLAPVPVNAGPRRITAVKSGFPTAARRVTVAGTEKAKVTVDILQSADESAFRPADGTDSAAGTVHQRELGRKKPARALLITSSILTGGCAIATGVFAVLALQAKNDFDTELTKVPNTRDRVDAARSKMKLYSHATDAFGVATLLSAGVVVYALLTDGGDSNAAKSSTPKRSLALAPSVGGVLLHGTW
jgi:tetratricopeptide (TPR) repeat protein